MAYPCGRGDEVVIPLNIVKNTFPLLTNIENLYFLSYFGGISEYLRHATSDYIQTQNYELTEV